MGALPFRLIESLCAPCAMMTSDRVHAQSFSSLALPELHDELQQECLYVAEASQLDDLCQKHPTCFFIAADSTLEPAHENGVVARLGEDRLKLLYRLNRACDPYFSWIKRLDQAILEGRSLQCLFDLSEPYLTFWTALVDDSCRLVAATNSIPNDDPFCCTLKAQGRISSEQANQWKQLCEKESTEDFVLAAHPLRYEALVRPLEVHGAVYGRLMLVDSTHKNDSVSRECAALFAETIQRCCRLRADFASQALQKGPADVLLEMLSRRETANENMPYCIHFAHELGFAKEMGYLFGFIRLKNPSMEALLNVYQFASEEDQCCLASIKSDQVLLLISVRDLSDRSFLDRLECYLKDCEGRAYLSGLCNTFTLLPLAYQQALVVRELSSELSLVKQRQVQGEGTKDDGTHIISFDELFLPWFLRADKGDYAFVKFCLESRFAIRLATTSSFDCTLVDVYLAHERAATAAAEALGMNRSTLVYNIRRIEKEYGVCFDDYTVRLEFQMILSYCRAFSPNLINEQPPAPYESQG